MSDAKPKGSPDIAVGNGSTELSGRYSAAELASSRLALVCSHALCCADPCHRPNPRALSLQEIAATI